jgi:hypothetical protein
MKWQAMTVWFIQFKWDNARVVSLNVMLSQVTLVAWQINAISLLLNIRLRIMLINNWAWLSSRNANAVIMTQRASSKRWVYMRMYYRIDTVVWAVYVIKWIDDIYIYIYIYIYMYYIWLCETVDKFWSASIKMRIILYRKLMSSMHQLVWFIRIYRQNQY